MKGLRWRAVAEEQGLGPVSTSGTLGHRSCQMIVPGRPCTVPTMVVQGRGCGQVTFIPMQRHHSAWQVPGERPRLASTSMADLLAGFNINPQGCVLAG